MPTYTLFASLRSPFARRIRLALARLNLDHHVDFMDVFHRNERLIQANPLALVPTLITPEVGAISDSAAILEYLDDKTGLIWPKNLSERTRARHVSTLCEGIMQYTVSYFLEITLHANPEPAVIAEYEDNILTTLTYLENMPENTWKLGGTFTQGAWDLGVALEYLVMRMKHLNAEKKFPGLFSVLSLCRESASFKETAPPAVT